MNCHPQTPQSPSQLSLAPSDSFNGMPSGSTLGTLPTPAHSVNGGNSQQEYVMDDLISKRKRSIDDTGDNAFKRLHIDTGTVGIEALHEEVGPKYLLLKQPVPAVKYPVSNDFFPMFGLSSVATELARVKPNGDKNILRKSFKNQLKRLKIDGGYDTKKDQREDNDPDGLLNMIFMPEDVWYANHVKEKELMDGFSAPTTASLSRASVMSRGKIRKEAWDSYILGSLDSGLSFMENNIIPSSAPNTPAGSASGMLAKQKISSNGSSGLNGQVADPLRPRRNIKKRSYADSGYEGYPETFNEDDHADGGYSTGDGDDRSGQKRRKKNAGNMSSIPTGMRQQAYGPGVVGA
ncbi:Mediator of RNA polymerase II transcription subunit 19 [Ceratocystis lukuohia]|uniref:Mediator of RNA polymerase II transcription subunit 19 n=1 Tax=Ceratocystis lukuohia TaxID=2019550 RepID=A0ABR4MHP7_9PEZI